MVGLLEDVESVAAAYNQNPFVRYGWFLGNGYHEVQQLLQEARDMALARPEGRMTALERRVAQSEEQVQAARMASEAALAANQAGVQKKNHPDDLEPDLDNNGGTI